MQTWMHTCTLALAVSVVSSCGGPPELNAPKTVTQYSIEDFYKNTAYRGADFSPDGGHIVVTSNQTGVFNVWAIALDEAPPRQLTSSTTNGIVSLGYFPRDERILYASDQGGNELTQHLRTGS